MGRDHQFNRIGNQLSTEHRHLHAHMPGGNAVADRNRREFKGGSAGLGNAQLDGLAKRLEMKMPGHQFVEGIDNGDKGFLQMFGVQPHGIKKGTMGGSIHPFGYHRTAQKAPVSGHRPNLLSC